MLARQRANAPAAEQVILGEALDGARRQRMIHDAAGQAVARIGADGFHLALLGVKRHGEKAFIFHPEFFIEALLEFAGLVEEFEGFVLSAEPVEHSRKVELRNINKRLFFAGSDRIGDLPAVFINNGVAGIFPTLVLQALLGARAVLVEAVAILIE